MFPKFCCHDDEIASNRDAAQAFFPPARLEEADIMKDAKTYREYAADCIRMAQSMDAKDRETLFKMAQAWEDRAREAERNEKKAESSR